MPAEDPTEMTDESIVDIDETALDREWINQPKLFYGYAIRAANARKRLADVKAEFEVAEATAAFRIRENPGAYGLPKVTEAGVTSATLILPEYKEALAKYNRAKHRVDLLDAAVSALEHRKRALEGLVTLHGQNYFATPTAGKAGREAADEMEKKATRSMGRP